MSLMQRGILRRICIALNHAKFISNLDIAHRTLSVAFVILAILYSPTAFSAALALFFSQLIVIIYAVYFLIRNDHLIANASIRQGMDIAIQSLPYFAATIFIDIAANLDIPILEHYSSPEEVGLMGSALRIQGALMLFIPIIQTSAQPTLARLFATDTKSYEQVVRELFRAVLTFGLFVGLGMAVFGDIAVKYLYGPKFVDASRAVTLLGPATLLTYLATFMGSTAMMTAKGFSMAIQMAVAIVINLGLSVWLIPYGVSLGLGRGAGMTATISGITEFVVVSGLWWILGPNIVKAKLMLHILFCFSVCLLIDWHYATIIDTNLATRALIFVLLFSVYAFATKLVKRDDRIFFKQLFLKKKGT